jgi:TonB family protein
MLENIYKLRFPILGIILLVLSGGCSTKTAEKGQSFSVEESLTEEGFFKRSTFCRIGYARDKIKKAQDEMAVNNYCEQFGKAAKIISQTSIRQDVFTPDNVRIKIGEICTTSFGCVIKKPLTDINQERSYVELLITINENGDVISSEVVESCGSSYLDKKVISIANTRKFDVKKFPVGAPFKRKFVIPLSQSDLYEYR